MKQPSPEPDGSLRHRARMVSASAVGNTLEWYDFAIFGFLTPYMSQVFFPDSDPAAGLLKTFGIFAAGYLMRPLGALFFGHIGDRIGRRQALLKKYNSCNEPPEQMQRQAKRGKNLW